MNLCSGLSLRSLTRAESDCPDLLPVELRDHEWPVLDPEWCWIVENSSHPIALVVTSKVHGILLFWRILSTSKARKVSTWFIAALPKILENARVRGCVAYASFFQDSRPEEARLARLMARCGGKLEPFSGSFGVNLIAKDGKRCQP